jgi:hypothetical protein
MRPETANYYGILIGFVCTVLHLVYGRWRSKLWPSFIRLGMSFLAGMGAAPVLQIAPLVVTPPDTSPDAVPVTFRVDDYRSHSAR